MNYREFVPAIINNMTRKTSLFYFTIIILFVLRCNFLLNQPPFVDEVGYAYLIKSIVTNFQISTLLLPLENGIPPVFIYCGSVVYFFIKNPILAGRLTSLILYIISIIIFRKYIQLRANKEESSTLLPLVFFALNPFIFLYSQMAIIEMSVVLFSLIFLYQSEITLSRSKKVDTVILSFIYLLVLLSKYTGIFIVVYFLIRCLQEKKIYCFINFALIATVLFLPLIPIVNKTFIIAGLHTNESSLFNPFRIKNNAFLIILWIRDYFSVPFLLNLSMLFIYLRKNRIVIAVLVTILTTCFSLWLTATNFFPRYFILIPLLFAVILSFIGKHCWLKLLIIVIICIYYLPADYYISLNLAKASIAKEDVWQYATDWTSGKNIVENLRAMKDNGTMCVKHEDYLYFSLVKESYFPQKKIRFIPLSPNQSCPTDILLTPKSMPTL